ncbi:Shikimate kinase AroK [Helicobacter sp. NHP19-012]|uniref:Shikimate kinase n=1 Tax=Helicobacter gastrofelis TaxID=2849642 RepID=A0ABN6I862_9HELI|nr:shikimate kinase [Helicobacter sp. NHP19-012]BCZ18912.1 Shikimate kinase AroK [Helicobacter sp. NHP19-012]
MLDPLSLNNKIWLIGFMGCGKSTLGACLAKVLGYRFLDTDLQIATQENLSIERIFKEKGEAYFRQLERALVANLEQVPSPLVIATGGGLPLYTPLKGTIIYLALDFESLYTRLFNDPNPRPLFKDKEGLHALYTQRSPLYAKMATLKLDANATPQDLTLQLVTLLRTKSPSN